MKIQFEEVERIQERIVAIGLATVAAASVEARSWADATQGADNIAPRNVPFESAATGNFVGETSLGHTSAKAEWWTVGVSGKLVHDIEGSPWSVSLGLRADYLDTSFQRFDRWYPPTAPYTPGPVYRPNGELSGLESPARDGALASVQPGLGYALSDQWRLLAAGGWRYAGADGSDISKATLWNSTLGALWRPSDSFSLAIGFVEADRFADSRIYLPYVGFNWRINPDWSLSLGNEVADAVDSGLKLTRHLDQDLDIFARLGYGMVYERFASDSSIPDGSLRYRAGRVDGGVSHRFVGGLRVTAALGAVFAQEYRFSDADGNTVAKSRSGASPTASLRISAGF